MKTTLPFQHYHNIRENLINRIEQLAYIERQATHENNEYLAYSAKKELDSLLETKRYFMDNFDFTIDK